MTASTDHTGPKLYKYGELRTKAAKEKARQWWIDGENDCFDHDGFTDFMKYEAEFLYGLTDLKIYWSLNYCQGDGVAFDGVVDMDAVCKLPTPSDGDMEQFKPTLDERMQVAKLWMQLQDMGYSLAVHVKQEGHYSHWNSMNVRIEAYQEPQFGNFNAVADFFRLELAQEYRNDPLVQAALDACEKEETSTILICCDFLEEQGIEIGQVRAILQVEEDDANALVNDLENALDAYFKACSRDLERRGYDELEHRQSEEYVADMLIANDYTFNYKGERCD